MCPAKKNVDILYLKIMTFLTINLLMDIKISQSNELLVEYFTIYISTITPVVHIILISCNNSAGDNRFTTS